MGETTIKNDYSISLLHKRLFAIVLAIAFLFLFVLGRLFYVQVIWGNELQEKAIDQWTREIPVSAQRGKIVDRNGVILATNDDTYTVFVRKKAVDNIEEVALALSLVLEMDYEKVLDRLTNTVSSEVTIKKQVSKDKINKLLKYNFNGVYYSRDNSRIYPYNSTLSSVIGFTSNDGKYIAFVIDNNIYLYKNYNYELSQINTHGLYVQQIKNIHIINKNTIP